MTQLTDKQALVLKNAYLPGSSQECEDRLNELGIDIPDETDVTRFYVALKTLAEEGVDFVEEEVKKEEPKVKAESKKVKDEVVKVAEEVKDETEKLVKEAEAKIKGN